jgi:hypothetical protein
MGAASAIILVFITILREPPVPLESSVPVFVCAGLRGGLGRGLEGAEQSEES